MVDFGRELIGKMQPELELLEVVAFINPFSPKAGNSIPSATKRAQNRWILYVVLNFS